ncbi:hypothetical protein [Mammaliicoccus lentus]|uniref:hypothetical protein n=1 Tax=Mammaliicoccus lentus TaxID=42858 RepID=UPI0011CBE205|nr:hypothetical protein [Mammaliicoccus lentus]
MAEWKIPHGIGLTPNGHNNTAIEMFLDNIVDSLTREVIQNSLDANDESLDKPVIVEFSKFEITKDSIPGYTDINDFALPKAKKYWEEKNNKDTLDYLNLFNQTLNSDTIDVLKISDYNTKGLKQKNYDSLVNGNGYSEKDNMDSAGSKGIGKAAPFAASNLRMVFYNSLSTEGEYRSSGIMNFVSFNYDEENITQERLSYCADIDNSKNKQFTFGQKNRNENNYGTDLFIIGLKKFDTLYNDIILSALNNFLLAIYHGKLEIIVDNEMLNSNTILDIIEKFNETKLPADKQYKLNKTKNFYEVITSKDTLCFNMDDERFEKYDFVESADDGLLYLLQHENANRTILQSRSAGMKIYERNNISGNINFSGIFQATGNKLNAFLKDIENANHNIWTPDRKQNNEKKTAEKFLLDLYRWYKQKVTESFATSSEDEVEAFGVRSLLPLESNEKSEDSKKDSGIKNKIENVKIKRSTKPVQLTDGDKEGDIISDVLKEIGLDEGDDFEFDDLAGKSKAGKKSKDNPKGGERNKSENDSKSKTSIERKEYRRKSNSLMFKIVEEDFKKGQYRILGKSKKREKNLEIELKYVGADGKSYFIELVNASSNKNKAYLKENNIILENIKKNDNININFEIDSKIKTKMEGTIYAVKA